MNIEINELSLTCMEWTRGESWGDRILDLKDHLLWLSFKICNQSMSWNAKETLFLGSHLCCGVNLVIHPPLSWPGTKRYSSVGHNSPGTNMKTLLWALLLLPWPFLHCFLLAICFKVAVLHVQSVSRDPLTSNVLWNVCSVRLCVTALGKWAL